MYRDRFIQAIHDKKRVRVTFDSKEDRAQVTRKCAPMDFGPSRRAREKNDATAMRLSPRFAAVPAHRARSKRGKTNTCFRDTLRPGQPLSVDDSPWTDKPLPQTMHRCHLSRTRFSGSWVRELGNFGNESGSLRRLWQIWPVLTAPTCLASSVAFVTSPS